jgi:hypothetical protein
MAGPAYAENQSLPAEILAVLHQAAPLASWDSALTKTADVTCDGRADTIAVGREGAETVWLVVIPGANGTTKTKPFVDSRQFVPVRIDLYPHSCESDEYGTLPGCKPDRLCSDFSLANDETDPLNFYWDSKRHSFGWWRN